MRRNRWFMAMGAAGIVALSSLVLSCQSTPKTKPEAQPSIVHTDQSGFSPLVEGAMGLIAFELSIGNPEALKSWSLEIQGKDGTVYNEAGQAPISDFSWDGKASGGALAPDGEYRAVLALSYGKAYADARAESSSFILCAAPPVIGLSWDPRTPVPLGGGVKEAVRFSVSAESAAAKIERWSLEIDDPEGSEFRSFEGYWPDSQATWDGLSAGGGGVKPKARYPVGLRVWDVYGNLSSLSAVLETADVGEAPEKSTISARRPGFSPGVSGAKNTIDLLPVFGKKEAVVSWELSVAASDGGTVRRYSGKAPGLPSVVAWDGKDEAGAYAGDGSYYALLRVDYGSKYSAATAKSAAFFSVLSSPEGRITAEPAASDIASIKKGVSILITVDARSAAPLSAWTLEVRAPDGSAFAALSGKYPVKSVKWDGKGKKGELPDPDTAYSLVALVKDEYGNASELKGTFRVSELPAAPEPSGIAVLAPGFSPNGDKAADQIEFSLDPGNSEAVESWKVEMRTKEGGIARSFAGGASALPSRLSWDGLSDAGAKAPDGSYYAALALSYGKSYSPVLVRTDPFLLVTSQPKVECEVSPKFFSPDGDGDSDRLKVGIKASNGEAKMESWTVKIIDQGGNLFASAQGRWPESGFEWDGKGRDGSLVESAADYQLEVQAKDEFGNVGKAQSLARVDILVTETATGYKIRVPSVVFKAYTADYRDLPPENAARNRDALDNLAEKLKKYSGYGIKIIGHTSMVYWNDPVKGKAEQEKVLIPLSRARSAAIKEALVARGIDAGRIVTDGTGAEDPVVPDSDAKNRWKNRRVDFFLDK